MKYARADFANRLRSERERLGLTQKELARKIDEVLNCESGKATNYNTISRWEDTLKKAAFPSLEHLSALCEIFGCDMEWLLHNPNYDCKEKGKTYIEKSTGLSEKAVERLVEAHKGIDGEETRMTTLVLNILLENVGFVFLAHSIKNYYLSLDEVREIEKNPHFKKTSHNEYAADSERIQRFKKFLENPKIPETSDFLSDVPEEYREAYKAALIEAVEENPTEIKTEDTVLMPIIRTALYTAWLKEKEERQPMLLYNIQKDFMRIIEEYGKQIDFFKESKGDSNNGTNNT